MGEPGSAHEGFLHACHCPAAHSQESLSRHHALHALLGRQHPGGRHDDQPAQHGALPALGDRMAAPGLVPGLRTGDGPRRGHDPGRCGDGGLPALHPATENPRIELGRWVCPRTVDPDRAGWLHQRSHPFPVYQSAVGGLVPDRELVRRSAGSGWGSRLSRLRPGTMRRSTSTRRWRWRWSQPSRSPRCAISSTRRSTS